MILSILLLVFFTVLIGAVNASKLYQRPETDNVTTWLDARHFCEARQSKLVGRQELCDYFTTKPLTESGDHWAPTIATNETDSATSSSYEQQWVQIGSGTPEFCQIYDPQRECHEETEAPTHSPTVAPTIGPKEIYTCGEQPGSTTTVLHNGTNPVALSTDIQQHSVCVLLRTSDGAALGRLYDAGAGKKTWQRSAMSNQDTTVPKPAFTCDGDDECQVVIPNDGNDYQLVTYKAPSVLNPKQEASRFLAQTTFGPKLEEIEALAAPSSQASRFLYATTAKYKEWIQNQMDETKTPPTLHREYFRRRANQRMYTANEVTTPRHACETLSRWHRFAFTQEDPGTVFTIHGHLIVSNNKQSQKVTEVDALWLEELDPAMYTKKEFVICTVVEEVHGAMEIDQVNGDCQNAHIVTNPPIQFEPSSIQQQEVLVDKVKLLPLEPPIQDVRLSQILATATCSEPDVDNDSPLFLQDPDTGDYYRHDGRMKLLENTLESVAAADAMRGALGDPNLCPNVDATFVNRDSCYVTAEPVCGSTTPLSLVCGSPGEVANEPSIGSRFPFGWPKNLSEQGKTTEEGLSMAHQASKSTWAMVSLHGKDQLRQRIAFALYGILVVGGPAYAFHESRNVYYDIFVRHAFGNYRDVLKEVSFHSLMGDYLTFRGSRSLPSSGTLPDENYARELLQLFTIGLNHLEMNGDVVFDPTSGDPVPTYDIKDIMSIARVWTGFQERAYRGNIEVFDTGHRYRNRMDPMLIELRWHDIKPKSDLLGGYIGDRYPLCTDLPERDFLRKGSTFDFVSSSDDADLVLDSGGLFNELCNPAQNGGPCRFAPRVVLDNNLSCHGPECNLASVTVVRVGDAVYKHVPRRCVSLQFFNGGRKAVRMYKDYWWWREACLDPREPTTAGEVCCDKSERTTKYVCPTNNHEHLAFASNEGRCRDKGMETCDTFNKRHACDSGCCPEAIRYAWSGAECSLKVKVDHEGHVATLHEVDYPLDSMAENKPTTWYDVDWEDENDIPNVKSNGCGSCQATGNICVCDLYVVEEAAFKTMPSRHDVLSRLKIGSLSPDVFDAETHSKDQSSADGLIVHRQRDSVELFNVDTIFQVENEVGDVIYLKNIISTDDPQNPSEEHRAHFEVDALLDHLMVHPNIAPFVAYRMIQRLVTSNPSPRYIEAVATAFRSGTYDGIGSGKNGDLAATVAAVLLHQDARTVALDADPSQGQLREPLLKLMYALRSLQVTPNEPEQQLLLRNQLNSRIGQMAHEAESIFSWFRPGYSSLGTRANNMGLVTPEAEILTTPQIVAFANSMSSLARHGVSARDYGPGDYWYGRDFLAFESSSPPNARSFSLPEGLDLTIAEGHMKGDAYALKEGVELILERGEGDKCTQQYRDGEPWTIWCKLEQTLVDKTGSYGVALKLSGSGGSVAAKNVVRWGWNGNILIFHPSGSLAEVNAAFRPGDTLSVVYPTTEEKCIQQYDKDSKPSRVRCTLAPTKDLGHEPQGKMTFDLTGRGGTFSARIIHWAWNGIHLYFDQDVSIDEVNAALPPGSPISLSVKLGDPIDDLELLLTNGRLSDDTRAAIAAAQNAVLGLGKDAALQYAIQLFFMTSEFQVSNVPNGLQRALPTSSKELQTNGPLKTPKTIVYVQLSGGADSFNMLVPHSQCSGSDLYAEYSAIRNDLAIPKDRLHAIDVPAGSQPCNKFGMHPSLDFLSTLYKEKDLLWVANTGSLVEPLGRDEVKSKKTPNNNFAHNIMTLWAEKVHTNNNRALGVLGRLADAVRGRFKAHAFSVRRTSAIQENDPAKSPLPDVISSHSIETLQTRNFYDTIGIQDALQNFTNPCSSVFCDLWSSAFRQGIKRTEELKKVVDANPLKAAASGYWKDDKSQIEKSFRQISRLLAGNEALGIDRLTFSAVQPRFDAHFDNEAELSEPLALVDSALESFVAEMKARGKWNEVVVVIGSEFGRALVSNGEGGCDHGWGGNYMVLGGAVQGGQILGDFIDDFNPDTNELMMRGGRVIPTTPWEAVWNGVAEWFGVPADRMLDVLPLKDNFPGRLFTGADMFKPSSLTRHLLKEQASVERREKTCEIDPNYIVCDDPHVDTKAADDASPEESAKEGSPTTAPTPAVTDSPTTLPTVGPTHDHTSPPTNAPTEHVTDGPTRSPTWSPSVATSVETLSPTVVSGEPSAFPTTGIPTSSPTEEPTSKPSPSPTVAPTLATLAPTTGPTESPATVRPTKSPTNAPNTNALSPSTPAPRTSAAVPTTGPKTAALVNTLPGSFGDPHIRGWNGATWDFHGSCDLVLLQDLTFHNGLGLTIHIRTQLKTWWSFIKSAAIQIGDDVLEVQGGGNQKKGSPHRLWVNGVEDPKQRTDFRLSEGQQEF
ncbi:Protein of unknown function (DUF1800) [Seminavis robusta]|uniref:Uncharacterized protein n=1 Tax=Seminavis robusta TaxID=568900 RepID=A0A9N8EDE4_9STRA|nr:Protein of unknown function (DUF1800) [Seminavis robusta]|eukprot:Sro833_g208540.1 Protein of unknown function (DUF1800) (2364) ;mRNA; f:8765-16977